MSNFTIDQGSWYLQAIANLEGQFSITHDFNGYRIHSGIYSWVVYDLSLSCLMDAYIGLSAAIRADHIMGTK